MKLSIPEQRLLDSAREEFGDRLVEFLSAGLGENAAAQRWFFTITFSIDDGVRLKRRVDVITYEPLNGMSYLPRRRDPLVLLGLLRLLLRGDHNHMRFRQEDVLNLLGWKNSPKTRNAIDEAVKRYFLLTYKWKMNKAKLERQGLSSYISQETVISEHEIIEAKDKRSKLERIVNRVVFNESFIEHLRQRSLFGIEWDNAYRITRRG